MMFESSQEDESKKKRNKSSGLMRDYSGKSCERRPELEGGEDAEDPLSLGASRERRPSRYSIS